MSEYTPTTEEVRTGWYQFTRNVESFDAWLASVKAEAIAEFIDETGVAVDGVRPLLAKAWDEGHKHWWRRGPDECQCSAWSWSECGCGKYGTGELLSLNDNPYREETTVRNRLIDVDEETE